MHASRPLGMLLTASLLAACAMGGVVSISEPKLSNNAAHGASLEMDGVLRIGDLSLSVKPQNARVGVLTVGPIVPFIPLGSGNELGKEKPFRVVVQFDTSDASYTFTPATTVLFHAGAQYRPAESVGPLVHIAVSRELEKVSRGHDWVCNGAGTASHPRVVSQDAAVPLSRSCFVLQFPVITPSPDQPFELELRGLKKGGKEIELPRIEFRPATTGSYSILGGAQSNSRLHADARKISARG